MTHLDMSWGQRVYVGTSGTLEQVLYGPSTKADDSFNSADAPKRTTVSAGYVKVEDLQKVEVVVSPYQPSEAR